LMIFNSLMLAWSPNSSVCLSWNSV
jgi:hypothetical protein